MAKAVLAAAAVLPVLVALKAAAAAVVAAAATKLIQTEKKPPAMGDFFRADAETQIFELDCAGKIVIRVHIM